MFFFEKLFNLYYAPTKLEFQGVLEYLIGLASTVAVTIGYVAYPGERNRRPPTGLGLCIWHATITKCSTSFARFASKSFYTKL